MPGLKHIAFVLDGGYKLVKNLHRFYSYVDRTSLLLTLCLLLFFLVLPILYSIFLFLNWRLSFVLRIDFKIDLKNYVQLKQQLVKLEEYVKYFHTFFNADKKSINRFMRPLFPLIKSHIHLQASYRNLLQEKIAALNIVIVGNRFTALNESTLWETRTKTYPYLA